MKESIRCCISCILPCGALDVIRIVHASGRVEEITHSVRARDIMEAYPKHVLRKPPSFHDPNNVNDEEVDAPPRAVVLPPNAELQRGKIYFLMPLNNTNNTNNSSSSAKSPAKIRRRKKRLMDDADHHRIRSTTSTSSSSSSSSLSLSNEEEDRARLLLSDQYLSEILSEKVSSHRERRRGRVGVWRPHLESISENMITNDF